MARDGWHEASHPAALCGARLRHVDGIYNQKDRQNVQRALQYAMDKLNDPIVAFQTSDGLASCELEVLTSSDRNRVRSKVFATNGLHATHAEALWVAIELAENATDSD